MLEVAPDFELARQMLTLLADFETSDKSLADSLSGKMSSETSGWVSIWWRANEAATSRKWYESIAAYTALCDIAVSG